MSGSAGAQPKFGVEHSISTPGGDYQELRGRLDSLLVGYETSRYSWWVHWRELAEYFLPRRYQWLISANKYNKGSPINQKIIDNTPTLAARTLASGMMSGITSPSRPWFRLGVKDQTVAALPAVKLWLDDSMDRMQTVMAGSNYYTCKAVQYFDNVVFGTAPMIIYEDPDTIIQAFNPCAGEYYCAAGKNNTVNVLARKFVLTIAQTVDMFGVDNVSDSVRQIYNTRGSAITQEIVIAHVIEPNPDYRADGGPPGPSGVARHFKFYEIYWEWGQSQKSVLSITGFMEQPFSCPRWDTASNDAYGRSPAMDALGDNKQLQMEQKRKAMAIDKMVNPPMVGDISMKNEPASLLPGGITYVPQLTNSSGFKPAFQVTPPIAELLRDIQEVQQRIKDTFFTDLFLMISQLDTVRSATEIDARKEEKLIQLGPVLERNNTEGLNPDIQRIFNIMNRNALFLPMPPEMRGHPINVSYISILADEQRATSTTSIERLFQFAGNLAAAIPGTLDNLDADVAIDIYADLLNVTPKILKSPDAVAKIRAQRSKEQQAAATMQTSMAAAQGAATLSQADVGGGQNALQALINGAPAGNA